jgi:hypothetical protein
MSLVTVESLSIKLHRELFASIGIELRTLTLIDNNHVDAKKEASEARVSNG